MSTISTEAAYTAASAMNALGVGMAASAHNVANINTAEFQPQVVVYESGPQGQGVQAQMLPATSFPAANQLSAAAQLAAASAAQQLPPEAVSPSGTDMAREFVAMTAAQNAYEANAVSIRAWDQMLGVIIDTKV